MAIYKVQRIYSRGISPEKEYQELVKRGKAGKLSEGFKEAMNSGFAESIGEPGGKVNQGGGLTNYYKRVTKGGEDLLKTKRADDLRFNKRYMSAMKKFKR